MENPTWTVATRVRHGRIAHRVTGLALTWSEAEELAREVFAEVPEGTEVYYVPTLPAEQTGFVCEEDQGTLLLPTGRRIPFREDGTLPEGITAPGYQPPAPRQRPLGEAQKMCLEYLHQYTSYPSGWVYGNHSTTVRILESLIKRGLVRKEIRTPSGRDFRIHPYTVYLPVGTES